MPIRIQKARRHCAGTLQVTCSKSTVPPRQCVPLRSDAPFGSAAIHNTTCQPIKESQAAFASESQQHPTTKKWRIPWHLAIL